MAGRPFLLCAALLLQGAWPVAAKKKKGKGGARFDESSGPVVTPEGNWTTCVHCEKSDSMDGFLKRKDDLLAGGGPASDVHVLWPTLVEVIPLTSDIGGWEDPSFHEDLAAEAIRGWRQFREDVKALPKGHRIRVDIGDKDAGALNDAFFIWQKDLYEQNGDVQRTFREDLKDLDQLRESYPDGNTTWPGMQGLRAYRKLRQYVHKFSQRYLKRAGVKPQNVDKLKTSTFSWCAINSPGEFHSPHTHIGEYHVAVFYASAGPSAGKLMFGDPRGLNDPFGRKHVHQPKAGHLVMFPAWQNHMATVTASSTNVLSQGKEPLRVIFSFNIGPHYGPLETSYVWSDPLADSSFHAKEPIDLEGLGLKG